LNPLKHALTRWTAFLWAVLKPLGAWGVFAIAGIDAAFLGMPLDAVVAGYVYANPHRFLLYALMGAAGSALGSMVVYAIGYEMGELVLEKRMGKAKFERMRDKFERHEFLTLALPAIFPPPFPFKLFALSAAVFEMHWTRYLLAIFAGRVARFLILSALVIFFGPRVIEATGVLVREHATFLLVSAGMAAAIGVTFWMWQKRKKVRMENAE
jgi:membrane protein YqaA with SNARE-associated domain